MQCLSSGNSEIRNLLCTIAYDGKYFHGWQIQSNAVAVQEVFQNALKRIIGDNFDIKGCSRTDSGVHALMYCVSIKTAHKIAPERLKAALNNFLPHTISVYGCKQVSNDFHARYSCKGKRYVYKIHNAEVRDPFLDGYALHYRYPIDTELLNNAGQAFVGMHDFTSFCTLDKRKQGDFTRNVTAFNVHREGDMVLISVEANGFLYNMVRIMVGTMLRIAQGKIQPDAIPEILNAKNRALAGPTAPPEGLYLQKVFY